MSNSGNDQLPGRGFLGWLGRQFGHVRRAVKSDPGAKKIYRTETIEEKPLPDNANVTLRRTTIDEVIVLPQNKGEGVDR